MREGIEALLPWYPSFTLRALAVSALALVVVVSATSSAAATMRSERIRPHLCETIGGGRFVAIPWFPGEKIDRRLLPDLAWMRRKYDIFVTDGYSRDPIHAEHGEHPIGLAADIVPDTSRGGTWSEIGELAHWAEPEQDHPRMPFRWVGWSGDPGHGPGDHLHLSWSHSATPPGNPARVVYTRICPDGTGSGSGSHHHHHHHHHHRRSRSGGTVAGDGGGGSGSGGTVAGDGGGGSASGGTLAGDGGGGSGSGGIGFGKVSLAPPVPDV